MINRGGRCSGPCRRSKYPMQRHQPASTTHSSTLKVRSTTSSSIIRTQRLSISRRRKEGRKAVVFLHNAAQDLPLKTSCEEESSSARQLPAGEIMVPKPSEAYIGCLTVGPGRPFPFVELHPACCPSRGSSLRDGARSISGTHPTSRATEEGGAHAGPTHVGQQAHEAAQSYGLEMPSRCFGFLR
ncbi:hypothetical protein BHE74_00053904 [Ensete ventricosum]|nr:hypothetical protein BHE74_00053904 [Ensete ventricosum]